MRTNELIYAEYLKQCQTHANSHVKRFPTIVFESELLIPEPLLRHVEDLPRLSSSVPQNGPSTEYMPVSGTIPPRPRATVRSVLAAHTSACQKPSVRMTNYGLNRLLITHAKEKGRMSTSFCKVNPNFVTWTSIIFCFLQDFLLEYFFKEILLIRLVVTFKKLPPLVLFITQLPLNVLSAEVLGIVSRTNCFPLLYET